MSCHDATHTYYFGTQECEVMATFDDLVDVINPVDKKQGIYDKNKDLIKMIYKTKDQYFFIIDLYNENTTHIYPGPNISFNEQNFTITLRAATQATPVDYISSLWYFIDEIKWVLLAIGIPIGLFLTFFGERMLFISEIIVGCVTSTAIIWVTLYSAIINTNYKIWIGWFSIFSELLFGSVLGLLLTQLPKIGAAMVCFWGGFSIALMLYQLIIYKLRSQIAFCIIICGVGLLFAAASFVRRQLVVQISTSIGGSYMIVTVIGLVIGNYANPFILASLVQNDAFYFYPYSEYSGVYYIYFIVNCAVAGIGAVFQIFFSKRVISQIGFFDSKVEKLKSK
eukprot:403356715